LRHEENPKRDGLGTIARLGPKTAFVGVGGRGSCLENQQIRRQAASLAMRWIKVDGEAGRASIDTR
jgi:hypothetical protein